MIYSILIASIIPLGFLYIVKWLNFFETHRPRLIFVALAWGVVACWLSYLVSHPMVPILGRQYISTHTAPFVEEIFKSLILLYLVRRSDHTIFVDGAIYGFAVGIGFSISENMLYLSRVDVETGLIVSIARAFSSSVVHGSTTALVGIAIGGFPMGRVKHPLLALLIGLVVAIALHMAFNRIGWMNLKNGLFIVTGFALGSLLLVAAAILWGLRRERQRLRRSLGMKLGVSAGEAGLVQRIEDLDDLLAPIQMHFGERKREQVASVLLLGAQLGLKQDLKKRTKDPELRAELDQEISETKRDLKRQRHDVGMYVMSYVRSIVPKTRWSLWALVAQTLTRIEPSRTNMWSELNGRVVSQATAGAGVYTRIRSELDTRVRGDPEEGDRLPDSMQKFFQWVTK
jgi:RsiW-degrading membrane proteinase PrsW (M82 family)